MSADPDITVVTRADGFVIEYDLNKCIGAGPCAIAAGKVFKIKDDGKAMVDDPNGDSISAIIEAANSCPVFAIIIKDKLGKQIAPPQKK